MPLRDERMQRTGAAPSCKVLDVPGWFHEMATLGALIREGGVSPADIDGRTWELAMLASRSIDDGAEAARWREKRRKEIVAAAVARGKGGSA